jgi:hypothetical protein
MKRNVFVLVLILALMPTAAIAKHVRPEKWCKEHSGRVGAVLLGGTRFYCLTSTHAREFDFGKKWAEAIGQALYYQLETGKKPSIQPNQRIGLKDYPGETQQSIHTHSYQQA